ncbi:MULTISPECIES: phage tail fiber protein [Providencia]|uniref:phage tail fiber protein n=1 Tax=Providencia TaxID=586 RepID=UPI00214C4039|nr:MULTISPECIES: hypothetical protein [Providencia]MDH2376010.1 hypothetical protein [Providencia rettgeri]
MYSTGTVTTTANSTKLVGIGTKWLNNINRVSAEQAIQIQIGTTVHNNSIQSIQSDTELTLNFPLPTAATGAKYVILTTMVHSVSDAMNKIVSMNGANVQFSDILTRWMTEQGIITVTLPDQTTQQLRTTKEMDNQLDGKFDKNGGDIKGNVTAEGDVASKMGTYLVKLETRGNKTSIVSSKDYERFNIHTLQEKSGTLMHVGDGGWMREVGVSLGTYQKLSDYRVNSIGYAYGSVSADSFDGTNHLLLNLFGYTNNNYGAQLAVTLAGKLGLRTISNNVVNPWTTIYSTLNTTKDSNGNLKAASPIVKLFADNIELNEESEGVEMEHLGIGHYLIKGVVGFNADGAWGINNGFVIPQDHNGKNMVLIDYEVRPDGDIEIFVFHQQNADMPERFQNKRIKHFDEEGVPVYFKNYEPCDVPESRWIDMRVEMPPNSLCNQKQVEAERLAKLEAERLAQEEAKRIAEEAERAEQEAAERKQYGLDDNSALL